jgi:hypothetical protein
MNVVDEINGYAAPVVQLIDLGRPDDFLTAAEWRDYRALGLSEEDIPQLIRMATDAGLHEGDPNSDEVWAPVHAWRALAQFAATEAAEPLMELAGEYPYDEGVAEELPHVFGVLGPETLSKLTAYLNDGDQNAQARACVANCIEQIGQRHSEAREQCKQILCDALANHRVQPSDLNGFLVMGLVDLRAPEHLHVIRSAYSDQSVDTAIMGDLEDAEIELGVRERRTVDRTPYWISEMLGPAAKARNTGSPGQRKIGRNEPCPCGSGKKYKKCCGG